MMIYKPIHTLSALQTYLATATHIAFDFETSPLEPYRHEEKSALDAHKATITGISFSVAEGDAVYLPLTHRTGQNAADQPAIWQWLTTEVFANPAVTKIAHNLAFESAFLYARGIIIQEPVYDTIAAAQLIYKNEKEFRNLADCGLKTLVPEYFHEELPTFAETTAGLHFDELDPSADNTMRYACADADYALRLYHLLNNWFDRFLPKHRYVVEKIESPTAVYVGLMRYNGLPIDRPLMEAKRAEAEARLVQLRGEIAFIIGDINIGANASTAAFKRYMFDKLGLPKMKQTAKENDALDDEAIILLKEWCAENRPELVRMFELVQEYRRWGKIKGTYIDGYLRYVNSATGRLHPDLLPLATETGRFASKNPNCQNMPRAGADDIGVRNFFVAPEGKILLSLDFSQIELRVGAFYCKDEKMLETYQSGGDIHALTTAVIYKIPLAEAADKSCPLYKERRTIAKNCNFGTFFGLFPRGLQRTLKFKAGLDVSLDECETIITNLKRGYPRLVRWQEEVKKRAGFRKYTETWLGRRRNIPEIASPDWSKKAFAERVAMNTPIQGTAADILKLAIGRIVQGLPERPWLRPLLQIHDELVFEIQGFRSLSGKKTWSDTLHDALVDHYGQEVLAALHADAVDLIPWSQLLIQRKTHLLYPMYYLLLMRFLAGSAENFYGGQHGMAHPYGQGPWPCRNPVCRYYLKDVIVDLPMVPHGSMWRATFSCPHCGFVYRRKQPLPKREQYAGQIDIVNRGPLWLDAFRKMMEEGAPYYRIAETLQCYFNTVKRLAVEQGFLPADQCPPSRHYAYPRRAKSATLPPAAHPPDYRELLLQAMRDHPGASRTFLIKNYPEAYCWLRANDVAWYEANAPASRVNTPADWVAKDEETLQKAMKAIAYLRKLPGRPVWINRRSVEKYGGIHNLYKNLCDGKLPNTQNLLDSNTETREDWSKRKIQWAIKTMMDEGKRLHLPQIQVCASISHKFFEPLIPFVLDFIEELQN